MDKTNKTCTKKTCMNIYKTKRASENNGRGLAREGSSLAFLFVRTRTFQQPLSVITTVWIVTHEYLFQRLEHLNLDVKVADVTKKV